MEKYFDFQLAELPRGLQPQPFVRPSDQSDLFCIRHSYIDNEARPTIQPDKTTNSAERQAACSRLGGRAGAKPLDFVRT